MPDSGTKAIEEVLDLLKLAEFDVVDIGTRYRITNPDGGPPAFMPKRLVRGATMKGVMSGLLSIGFDKDNALAAREKARQKRISVDRAAAKKLIEIAEVAAKMRRAPLRDDLRPAAVPPAPALTPAEANGRPDPRVEIITLDAEFAAALLKANHWYEPGGEQGSNRRYYPELARRYARDMVAGRWRLTHQGFALDWNGHFLDGQHRCAALVLATEEVPDLSFPVQITYDLPPDTRRLIDTGRRKTNSDFLQMEGHANAALLAVATRLCILYDTQLPIGQWRRDWPSVEEIVEYVEREPSITDAVRLGANIAKRDRLLLAAGAAAGLHVCRREWPEVDAERFIEALCTGEDLSAGSPILALRNFLVKQRGKIKRKRDNVEHFALFVKAWNGWVTGAERHAIRLSTHEEFPRVTPNPALAG